MPGAHAKPPRRRDGSSDWCPHYLKGRCFYGASCRYPHPPQQEGERLIPSPPATERAVCNNMLSSALKWLHDETQEPPSCKYGAQCKFLHLDPAFGARSSPGMPPLLEPDSTDSVSDSQPPELLHNISPSTSSSSRSEVRGAALFNDEKIWTQWQNFRTDEYGEHARDLDTVLMGWLRDPDCTEGTLLHFVTARWAQRLYSGFSRRGSSPRQGAPGRKRRKQRRAVRPPHPPLDSTYLTPPTVATSPRAQSSQEKVVADPRRHSAPPPGKHTT